MTEEDKRLEAQMLSSTIDEALRLAARTVKAIAICGAVTAVSAVAIAIRVWFR